MTRPSPLLRTLAAGLPVLAVSVPLTAARAQGDATAAVPPLKGKRIGVTAIGTDHYRHLKAYEGAIDEVKRLGGAPARPAHCSAYC